MFSVQEVMPHKEKLSHNTLFLNVVQNIHVSENSVYNYLTFVYICPFIHTHP